MAYLEGETLSNKVAHGSLPLAQALQTGIEIADAPDKAHRRSIVHRDLKPGNIMLTPSGAKLLDFGLAQVQSGGTAADLSAAPTMTSPLTGTGSIVGTFQYMAPEQLEGREADARSDIFAFGAVLYEMVTGKRAFIGATQASVIAAILKDTPPEPSTLQPLSPSILDGTITTCLAKSPEDRWQTAGDVGRQLKLIQASTAAGSVARGSVIRDIPVASTQRPWLRWAAVVAAVVAPAVALALVPGLRRTPPPQPPVRFSVITPATLNAASLAVSPDGRYVAFTAGSLFIRAVDSIEAQPLAGTLGAQLPFWSPDSRHIGFAAVGQLKRISLAGGPPQTLLLWERQRSPVARGMRRETSFFHRGREALSSVSLQQAETPSISRNSAPSPTSGHRSCLMAGTSCSSPSNQPRLAGQTFTLPRWMGTSPFNW